MQAALLADDEDQVWEAAQEWARERETEQWAQARREAEPAVVPSPLDAAAGAATVGPSPLEVPPADVAPPPDAAAGAATVAPSPLEVPPADVALGGRGRSLIVMKASSFLLLPLLLIIVIVIVVLIIKTAAPEGRK